MPYKHEWLIEGQVIKAEIWGDQTIEELQESNAVLSDLLDSADNRLIHVIINDENLESVPLSIFQMQKTLTYTKHPNLGWAVMIGEKNRKIKDTTQDFVITLLAKVTRARFIRLKTLEDALQHLRKVDQTINWNIANK